MSETPNLGLPYMEAGQAQKHVTHNEALRLLDTLVQLAVQDRDLTAPPGAPGEGQRWIVKAAASDAWTGRENQIAAWQDGAWEFSMPSAGWLAYVIGEAALAVWNGTAWGTFDSSGTPDELQNISLLGIGTEADATNPVSAKLNNVLWSAQTVAEGGDGTLRYKLSKESASKNLSFLFQDNFSGRAEIGLTGDDDFHCKVSPDGTAWLEAIKIDRATGRVSFPVSGGPREVLTANRVYYVRADGSNGNTGLADNAGGAFLTIQKAFDAVSTLDCSTFGVTIQIADGTYTGANTWRGHLGSGTVTLQGNNSTPASVAISVTGNAFLLSPNTALTIKDLKLSTAISGHAIQVRKNAQLYFNNLDFGAVAAAGDHIRIDGGYAEAQGSYKISGSAYRHLDLGSGGQFSCYVNTITVSGAPAWGGEFIYATLGSGVSMYMETISGSAAGKRYTLDTNSVINSFGAGSASTYFPGNADGTVSSGGQQV